MNPRLLAMLLSRYMQPNNVTSVPETPLVRAPVDAQTIMPKNVQPMPRTFDAGQARAMYQRLWPNE